MRSLTLFSLVLALSACGGDGGTTDATGTTQTATTSGSTGTGSTGSESGTGEPTTSGASTFASTGADASTSAPATATSTSTATTTGEPGSTSSTSDGTTGDSTTGDSTTGATSELVIAVFDAELYADCMPEVEPDPVQGSWYVQFDNTGGGAETSAVLTKASLSLLVDDPVLEEISVSPSESGPIAAGEQIEVVVKKLKGAAHSGCDHCGEFYLLALEYQEGDVIHQVTEEVTISCAF